MDWCGLLHAWRRHSLASMLFPVDGQDSRAARHSATDAIGLVGSTIRRSAHRGAHAVQYAHVAEKSSASHDLQFLSGYWHHHRHRLCAHDVCRNWIFLNRSERLVLVCQRADDDPHGVGVTGGGVDPYFAAGELDNPHHTNSFRSGLPEGSPLFVADSRGDSSVSGHGSMADVDVSLAPSVGSFECDVAAGNSSG